MGFRGSSQKNLDKTIDLAMKGPQKQDSYKGLPTIAVSYLVK